MTLLDALTDGLDAAVLGRLGDPVLYRPLATPGVELSVNTFVDHSDDIEAMGGSAIVVGDVRVQVRKIDIAAPARGDEIVLTRRGETRKVRSAALDPSGRWWNLVLAKI